MALKGATIIQVIPDLGAGGAERTTIEVAEALVAAGARAIVASAGGRMEDDLKAVGGELARRKSLPSKVPITIHRNADWLAKLVKQENAQILHARSRAPAWAALWASKRSDAHFVTTYHGAYNAKSSFKRWYNSVMARGEKVIANSEFIAAHIKSTYPAYADKIITIPRGVDLEIFAPEKVDRSRIEALKEEWFGGEKPTGRLVVLPGRLTRWKGQLAAVHAAARVKQTTQDWHLVFVGDPQGRDDYVSELKTAISDNALDNHITLAPHCSDMAAAYKLADIVLAPSQDPEAFGRVAAEAGAMETPVIVSDHGGQREVVIQGETGVRTPPGNVDALAVAMLDLIQAHPDRLAAIGAAARERVSSGYSKTSLQTATLKVYQSVLGDANG